MEDVHTRAIEHMSAFQFYTRHTFYTHSPSSPEEDARTLLAIRGAVGPTVGLRADANRGWSLEEAVRFAHTFHEGLGEGRQVCVCAPVFLCISVTADANQSWSLEEAVRLVHTFHEGLLVGGQVCARVSGAFLSALFG